MKNNLGGTMTELPGVKETFNDDLARSIHDMKTLLEEAQELKDKTDVQRDKVLMEMKKDNRKSLVMSIDGDTWLIEIKDSEEKLRFGKAKKA